MKILTYPNPILKEITTTVVNFDERLKKEVQEMIELLHKNRGLGLAAPQVSLKNRFFIIDLTLSRSEKFEDKNFKVFINPRITWRSSEKVTEFEGCLSLPGLEGKVTRPKKIRIKAKDLTGNKFSLSATDWLARVCQHELDHLDGILYIDYIKNKKDLRKVKS